MQIKITITGMDSLDTAVRAKIERIKTQVSAAVQGAGIDCQAGAKQDCPVDTGRLRSSIQYVPTGRYSCQVGTNVFYGKFVELGTRKMGPRPFLFPAYQSAKKTLRDELSAIPGVQIESWSQTK